MDQRFPTLRYGKRQQAIKDPGGIGKDEVPSSNLGSSSNERSTPKRGCFVYYGSGSNRTGDLSRGARHFQSRSPAQRASPVRIWVAAPTNKALPNGGALFVYSRQPERAGVSAWSRYSRLRAGRPQADSSAGASKIAKPSPWTAPSPRRGFESG